MQVQIRQGAYLKRDNGEHQDTWVVSLSVLSLVAQSWMFKLTETLNFLQTVEEKALKLHTIMSK